MQLMELIEVTTFSALWTVGLGLFPRLFEREGWEHPRLMRIDMWAGEFLKQRRFIVVCAFNFAYSYSGMDVLYLIAAHFLLYILANMMSYRLISQAESPKPPP